MPAAVRRGVRRSGHAANAVANHSQHGMFNRYGMTEDGGRRCTSVCAMGLPIAICVPHTVGGSYSVSMVYQACGCRPQCGKCVPFVRQMLREGSEAATAAQADGAD